MLLDEVEVVSIEDDGFYSDAYTSGSCVKVTLCKGNVYASCEQILIWEEEYAEDCFNEWVELADAGEEGYATWTE